MSHLNYFNYKGFGENMKNDLWYSQAVRVGVQIHISGQGGWDPLSSPPHYSIPKDIPSEFDQAFTNVDMTLKHAGGKGWSQVFKVTMYVTEMNDEIFEASTRNFKSWCPDHQPLFTLIQVKGLGLPGMHVEVEVVAHHEEGTRKAAGIGEHCDGFKFMY